MSYLLPVEVALLFAALTMQFLAWVSIRTPLYSGEWFPLVGALFSALAFGITIALFCVRAASIGASPLYTIYGALVFCAAVIPVVAITGAFLMKDFRVASYGYVLAMLALIAPLAVAGIWKAPRAVQPGCVGTLYWIYGIAAFLCAGGSAGSLVFAIAGFGGDSGKRGRALTPIIRGLFLLTAASLAISALYSFATYGVLFGKDATQIALAIQLLLGALYLHLSLNDKAGIVKNISAVLYSASAILCFLFLK